jgi:sister chromatid cohesion protein DCC1
LKTGEADAPCEPILQALEVDHRVSREVSKGVLTLFGEVVDSDGLQSWKCNINRVVRELGIGLLHALGVRSISRSSANPQHKQQPSDAFVDEWKEQVGETWADLVNLKTLDVGDDLNLADAEQGNYLLTPVPISFTSTASAPLISAFFVHTLSTDPATRFGDLFLTRPKWRPEDMKPFLHGLTPDGDQKGMDRMIVKFVRVVKESNGGVWWHPRRSV